MPVGDLTLALLDRLPERVVDEAQLRHFGDDPVSRRIEATPAWVLIVALAVPHQPADIMLLLMMSVVAPDMAADKREAPLHIFTSRAN